VLLGRLALTPCRPMGQLSKLVSVATGSDPGASGSSNTNADRQFLRAPGDLQARMQPAQQVQ
jgi:hypothetical protein